MPRHAVHPLFVILAAAAVAASIHVGSLGFDRQAGMSFKGIPLRCVIQLDHSQRHLPGLTVGYNYELLQRFASSMGDSLVSIVNPRKGSSWTDSLLQGKVDIVVLPCTYVPPADSMLLSRPVDSLTVWAVRKDCAAGLAEINEWLGAFLDSEEHEPVRDVFLLRYSPSKRAEWKRGVGHVSPYDSLVTDAAIRLGWDWRLLSALIYQESEFHIELRSRRGAEGLMQMLPSTAAKMGFTDLFNPKESIKAGTEYLLLLQNMFRSKAADKEELCKFTLAAYNAGEGRIMDCIRYAESVGVDSRTWEGVASVIPEIRDEATIQVDSVLRLGTFEGSETIYYVKRVLSLYEDFKVISP
ncbi:MAG: transglycosylase SLT domain-containing protein [Bacteroidales bacterium]|nr:transglycosylase SLT domain-containing protein [Bacteroidales bacterium]